MPLSDKISVTPMLRMAIPLSAGIILAGAVTVPAWLLIVVAAVCYALGWIMYRSPVGNAYIFCAIMASGILFTRLHGTENRLPAETRLVMTGEVLEIPKTSGRWLRAKTRITMFREADRPTTAGHGNTAVTNADTPASSNTGAEPQPLWHKAGESVILNVDTCYRIEVGDLIGVRGYFNHTDTSKRQFAALMKARGITGYVYVVPTGLTSRAPRPKKSASYYAASVQGWAVERIMRLKCDTATRAMVATLVAGDKRFLSKATVAEYSKVGASHILAVSGLHMSFVFVMVNLLLVLVTLTPRGHIIKNGIVILMIWLYALMSGLAPSAVRAAIMLSAVQLSLGLSAGRNSYNILFGAAVVMLAVNPYYLFDVGFQLSFMAVLSILFFLPRMVRWLPLRSPASRKVASIILIGLAAQVGVMPILAYNFGSIPLLGLLISPIISYTAFVIIALGLVWVVAPIGFLSGIMGSILELFVTIQNGVVAHTATSPYAAVAIDSVSGTGVLITYFVIFVACFTIELWEDSTQPRSTARA